MTPQGFNENSRLRASDADRDAAAAVINNALAEGRLTAEEHSDRLDAIYSARTHAEIVPLLDDLPAAASEAAAVGRTSGTQPARAGRGGRIVAIFGGASRKGGWHAEPVITVLAVFGGVELDFREAVLPGNEVVLKATAILGGVDVTVPPEMRVIDDGGVAILGGREITGSSADVRPDAPVLRIEGTCVLGGIEVKRKARRRRGDKGGNGITIRLPGGDLGLPGLLGQVREHRRDIHNEIRAQRHEILDQVRAQRRDARRNWTRDSEE